MVQNCRLAWPRGRRGGARRRAREGACRVKHSDVSLTFQQKRKLSSRIRTRLPPAMAFGLSRTLALHSVDSWTRIRGSSKKKQNLLVSRHPFILNKAAKHTGGSPVKRPGPEEGHTVIFGWAPGQRRFERMDTCHWS